MSLGLIARSTTNLTYNTYLTSVRSSAVPTFRLLITQHLFLHLLTHMEMDNFQIFIHASGERSIHACKQDLSALRSIISYSVSPFLISLVAF